MDLADRHPLWLEREVDYPPRACWTRLRSQVFVFRAERLPMFHKAAFTLDGVMEDVAGSSTRMNSVITATRWSTGPRPAL
jgi:hypothetical protein